MPNVAVIIGEGGSGGAIAIATANRVLMLEHAIYSVISPEGAASILWRDTTKAQDAATNMKITAEDLLRFGVIDAIVPEPVGGAHRDPAAAIDADRRRDRGAPWPSCKGSTARRSAASAARSSWPSAARSELSDSGRISLSPTVFAAITDLTGPLLAFELAIIRSRRGTAFTVFTFRSP